MPLPPLPSNLLSPCMQIFLRQAVIDTLRPIAQRLKKYNTEFDEAEANIQTVQNEINKAQGFLDYYTGIVFCLTKTITTIGVYLFSTPCAELTFFNDMLKDQRAEAQALIYQYSSEIDRLQNQLAGYQQMAADAQALVNSAADMQGSLREMVTTIPDNLVLEGALECLP